MSISAKSAIVFPLVMLSLLALLTFWINHIVQLPTAKLDGSSRHDPDYIVRNFVTTQTDINGDLKNKLTAVEMRHFPDDDSTTLQQPRYTQFAIGKPYTKVEGLHGYVSSDGKEVQVVDNVKVTRQAFAEKGEMTVDTDYLSILPNDDIVRTASPVVIRQAPKTIIYATGMLYEKKIRTVTLLHKVRAHYERPGLAKARSIRKGQPVTKKTIMSKVIMQPSRKLSSNSPTIDKPVTSKTSAINKDKRIRRSYE